jgi:hypothetical protein
MAHVQIPAREDVQGTMIHQSAPIAQQISLTGEGCEVEQIDAASFVIRVAQPSFDAFNAISDLSPVYDALHDVEKMVHAQAEQSKELQEFVNNIHDVVPLLRFRIHSLEEIAGRLQNEIDGMTANQYAARQKQTYITLAAFISIILSFLAVGVALWTSKV